MHAPSSSGRLLQIDSLRALAALAVVAFHYTTRYDEIFMHVTPIGVNLSLGAMGVQLFFAISGFVIFMTMDRVRHPLDFVVWRASRLYPAYWAAVLITWAVVRTVGMPGHEVGVGGLLVNFTMLQFFFNVHDVDGVYWSLQVELVFYVWMLLLWSAGLLRHAMWLCLAWTGLSVMAGLAGIAGMTVPYTVGYFLLLKSIPWFAIGMVAYVSKRDGRFGALHGATLAACVAAALLQHGVAGLVVSTATILLVFGASRGRLRALEVRPIVYVGAISYPLYLVHENIGFLAIGAMEHAGAHPWIAIAVAFAVTLALAAGLHHAVELPASKALRDAYAARRRAATAAPSWSLARWVVGCAATLGVAAVSLIAFTRLAPEEALPPIARANEPRISPAPGCSPEAAGTRQALVIVLGQSNAASHTVALEPAAPVRVLVPGGCLQARDPLPNTTGRGASIWSAVPSMVAARRSEEIVLAPLAIESTRIDHWLDDRLDLRKRLEKLLAAARGSGLPILAVYWQQGESDAKRGTEARRYRQQLLALRRLIDRAGIEAPLVVARSTWCEGRDNDAIRRAIEAASAENARIRVGPDFDRLEERYRLPRSCHLNAEGRLIAAQEWSDQTVRLLETTAARVAGR